MKQKLEMLRLTKPAGGAQPVPLDHDFEQRSQSQLRYQHTDKHRGSAALFLSTQKSIDRTRAHMAAKKVASDLNLRKTNRSSRRREVSDRDDSYTGFQGNFDYDYTDQVQYPGRNLSQIHTGGNKIILEPVRGIKLNAIFKP